MAAFVEKAGELRRWQLFIRNDVFHRRLNVGGRLEVEKTPKDALTPTSPVPALPPLLLPTPPPPPS